MGITKCVAGGIVWKTNVRKTAKKQRTKRFYKNSNTCTWKLAVYTLLFRVHNVSLHLYFHHTIHETGNNMRFWANKGSYIHLKDKLPHQLVHYVNYINTKFSTDDQPDPSTAVFPQDGTLAAFVKPFTSEGRVLAVQKLARGPKKDGCWTVDVKGLLFRMTAGKHITALFLNNGSFKTCAHIYYIWFDIYIYIYIHITFDVYIWYIYIYMFTYSQYAENESEW